ncbi:uncharacterized protein LOC132205861 [Neocloeon triangulifer]|uniref:uncharacterized protein LOC132205861 n=1 Tax=Neocloeon triangulifer TaxID=2078957 RepID=UPI00286F2A18|nr:uncharacterized protein LOC132205861 [Neocloeon triangulifer]
MQCWRAFARQRMLWTAALVAICFFSLSVTPTGAINCFTCSSVNGSDKNCMDPFNPGMSTYKEKCMVPKQGHVGVFPANFCIKIRGINIETSSVMYIRACAMKTMDSQCGNFKYQDQTMTGCILTCDYDGCNSAPRTLTGTANLAVAAATLAFVLRR